VVKNCWFDEEPPADVYEEGLARTIATRGMAMLSFTPLQGYSAVVNRFLGQEHPDRAEVCMTIYDAEHLTDEERKVIIASFPSHTRQARALGIPTLGEGAIFPVEAEAIAYQPFPIPDHFFRLCGADFGWTHPAAFAWIAVDRDSGVHYVYDAWRGSEVKTPELYAVWKARGTWIPVAWPKDGLNETAAGPRLARQYGEAGIFMLPEHATHDMADEELEASKVSVEAGVMQMLDMFTDGTLKIASHLTQVFDEIRMYRRDKGRIVAERDDLISAIRYALMMSRYAVQAPRSTRLHIPVPHWRAI
jgi:phage terminase large subunit-like protein